MVFDEQEIDLSGVTPPAAKDDLDDISLNDVKPPVSDSILASYHDTLNVAPDDAARVMKLAKQLGEIEPLVAKDIQMAEKVAAAPSRSYAEEFAKANPKAAEFLADRRNMAVAKDDFESMGAFEGFVDQVSAGWRSGAVSAKQAELSWPQLMHALETNQRPEFYERDIRELEKESAGLQEKFKGKPWYSPFEAAQMISQLRLPAERGLLRGAQGALTGATVAGVAGPAAPVAVPAAAAGGFGIGGKFGAAEGIAMLEAGQSFRDFIDMKDKDGNPIAPRDAATAAMAVGLANAGLEYASLSALSKVFPPLKRVVDSFSKSPKMFEGATKGVAIREAMKRWLIAGATEAGTEVAQQGTQIGAREVLKNDLGLQASSPAEMANEALSVIPPTLQAILYTGGIGAGTRIMTDLRAIQKAEETKQVYTALGKGAEASKVRQRLPETHRQFVEQVTKDSPVENIFIPAQAFETYFQSKKIDPEAVARELGVGEKFKLARESGGDVPVPLAVWTEKVVGSEHYDGLAEDVKFAIEDLTPREAKEKQAEIEKGMKDLVESSQKILEEEVSRKQGANLVFNEMKQELLTAKPKDMAPKAEKAWLKEIDANAKLWSARAVVEAKRRGITIEDYWKDHKPEIVTETRPYRKSVLQAIRREIEAGSHEKGALLKDDEGYVTGRIGAHSSFPDYFRNKGYGKEPTLNAIDKYLAGESLTEKQAETIKDLYFSSGYANAKAPAEVTSEPFLQGPAPAPAPAFYSKLQRMVEEKLPNKATAEQVRALTRDVNKEELQWSGLEQFLTGKEKISKDELLEFLTENQIVMQEVTKGAENESLRSEALEAHNVEQLLRGDVKREKRELEDALFERLKNTDKVLGLVRQLSDTETRDAALEILALEAPGVDASRFVQFKDKHTQAYAEAQRLNQLVEQARGLETKFSQYVLPGGGNYREVLFTLPPADNSEVSLRMDEIERILTKKSGPVAERDALRAEYAELAKTKKDKTHIEYRSGHWDEANVLAHTRLTDRTDMDGKRVLFVEEIQSDWHQEGRKKGYRREKESRLAELIAKRDAAKERWAKIVQEAEARGLSYLEAVALDDAVAADTAAIESQEQINNLGAGDVGVPDAPFKKNWHEFVLKRILRMAAEGGYDRVAWTTGEQQAERYDLSKQVDSVAAFKRSINESKIKEVEGGIEVDGTFYRTREDAIADMKDAVGTYDVEVYKDKQIVIEREALKESELEELVGKELAQKIIKGEGGKQETSGWHVYSGLDLKIGGDGMNGFYDKILPDFLKKYTKKWGGKVEQGHVETSDGTAPAHALDVTPAMRQAVLYEGQTLFQKKRFRREFTDIRSELQKETPLDEAELLNPVKAAAELVELAAAPEGNRELKKKAIEFLAGEHAEIKNDHTSWLIQVQPSAKKKALGSISSAPQSVAILNLPELIKNAKYVWKEQDRKVPGTEVKNLYALLQIGNATHLVKIILKEEKGAGKSSYYSVRTVEIEQNSADGPAKAVNPPAPLSIAQILDRINERRKAGDSYFQDEDTPRGAVQFGPAGAVVMLFKTADASTFLHESAHIWLKETFDYVKNHEDKLTPQYAKDWLALTEWLKISPDQESLTVEQQEQFARGFEAYVREGNAPSETLRRVFRSFRLWLTRIYRDVRGLDVELSKDVRGVMDRMLATEEEIEHARKEVGYEPAVANVEGLDPEVAEKLRKLQEQAHEEAVSILLKGQMDELKEERKTFLDERRESLRKEAAQELSRLHIYSMMSDIRKKMENRQSAQKIARDYMAGKLKAEHSAMFEALSEIHVYSSPDEMAQAILAAEPFQEKLSKEVQIRMQEYEDLRNTTAIKDAALSAIHNEKTVELMALEREILEGLIKDAEINVEARKRRINEAKLEAAAARDRARAELAKLNIRAATQYLPFFTTERRWAGSVAKALAEKDFERAALAKQSQLFNHALALESLRIKRKVDKWIGFLEEVQSKKPELFKKEDHFNQAADLLARFGFPRKDFNPMMKRESLAQWAERMNGVTNTVAIPDWIIHGNEAQNYKNLTPAQLEDVVSSIKNILSIANFENRALVIGKGADLKSIIGDLSLSAKLSIKLKDRYKPTMEPGKLDDAKQFAAKYLLSITKIQTLLRKADGYKDEGQWWNIFWKPVYEAANKESELMSRATEGFTKLWAPYSAKERKELIEKRIYFLELGTSATKSRLLAMALNMGNIQNRDKLFLSKPVGIEDATEWNEQVVRALLDKHLTKKDWEFVQNTWDLINELWPQIAKMHKELTGFTPGKVEASPFNVRLPDGTIMTMRGGYYPLKEDPRASLRATIREQLDSPLYTEKNPGWMAATRTGHTKARTEAQYSVSLDITLPYRHLRDVIHDLAFRPTVIDLRRLLNNEEMHAVIQEALGPEGYIQLREWVNTVASGNTTEKTAAEVWERTVGWLRRHSVIAALMMKPSVIIQNLANPFLFAGAVDGFGYKEAFRAFFVRGVLDYHRKTLSNWKAQKQIKDFVYSKSAFMRDKRTTPDFSLNETHNKLFGKDSKVQEFATALMAGSDELSSIPMWLEAYYLKMDEGLVEEEDAIRYADTLIDRVLGSGRKYDTPAIQRGGELAKSLSMFYSFLNTEYNRWAAEAGIAQMDPKQLPRFLGFVGSRLLFFVPASALLSGRLPHDDEEKLQWWLKEILSYPFQLFPGFREMASVSMDHALGLQSFGYKPSPAAGAIETGLRAVKAGSDLFQGEGDIERFLEATSRSAAYLAPYPDQFNAWFWNAYDYGVNGMEPQFSDFYRRRPTRER